MKIPICPDCSWTMHPVPHTNMVRCDNAQCINNEEAINSEHVGYREATHDEEMQSQGRIPIHQVRIELDNNFAIILNTWFDPTVGEPCSKWYLIDPDLHKFRICPSTALVLLNGTRNQHLVGGSIAGWMKSIDDKTVGYYNDNETDDDDDGRDR